jgi:hypothetical protein
MSPNIVRNINLMLVESDGLEGLKSPEVYFREYNFMQ